MKTLVMFLLVMLFSAPCYGQDRYQLDTPSSPYIRYGERYSNYSSRYATNPPKIYSGGKYLGELSADRYRVDSISNPYGIYGSRYSADSVNNPYGIYGVYSTQPIYVYPGK